MLEKTLDASKVILGVKSDYEMSKVIGVSQPTVVGWRKKNDKIGPLIDALIASGHRVEIRLNDELVYSPPKPTPTYQDLALAIAAASMPNSLGALQGPGVLNAFLHIFKRLDEIEVSGQPIASKDDLIAVWQGFKPSWWKLEPMEASAKERKVALALLEQVAHEAVDDALANRKEFVKALNEVVASRRRLFG